MNAERLLQHFDRICEAPEAIPRLRRFILDLAVRGKLVPQDPNDEPAAELLKRIQVGKARLVKEGKIRAPRASEPFEGEENHFSLPLSWKWCQLTEVGAIVGGGTPSSGDQDNFTKGGQGFAWLTPADLGKHKELYISHGARDLTGKGLRSSSATLMPEGSVLFTSRAPIGYTAIAANEISTNQGFKSVVPYVRNCSRYIAIYFQAFAPWIDGKASGTTFREVSGKIVASLPFPLPPLAEQHRIVAKVDELMALCDQLEAAKTEREQSRDRLVAASLHHLNQPTDAEEADTPEAFRNHARFIFNHLSRLTTRPEHIKQLRQSILNLAVRGKLVLQDPNDEPSSELFKRIQAKKAQLVKKGELKKDKAIWEGLPKEAPYSLPPEWTWTHLQDIFEISRGGSPRPAGDPRYFGGSIPWITVREITKDDGKYLLHTEGSLTEEGAARSRFINPGDLLLTNSGATLGVPKISKIRGCMNDGVAVLRLFHLDNVNDFAFLYLLSQTQAFRQINQGMGQPNLNTPIIAGWFFPLPPLVEQHRIVAKVDELMALCDQLEAQLTATEADSRRLLEAVLHEALAPALEETA
jgi:type I restriction enzyme, S subunit